MPPESDPAVPPHAAVEPATTPGGARSRLEAVERRLTELTRDQRQAVRELSTLLEEHRTTRGVAQSSADAVAEALPRLDAATDVLVELRGRVDAITTQLAATPRIAAVPWPALTADEASEVWDALAAWISDVLGPFYRITRGELPDCWARHPDAVLELVWLHTSYREAFENTGRPSAAAEWHTRWRSNTLEAVAAAIPARLCRPGEHLVSERDADAARSDARDARARAATSSAARHDSGGARSTEGYRPPPRPNAEPEDAAARPTYDPQREQVISREHWIEHFEQGRADDLAWRRRREQ